ncbi:MAG TPA: peptide chain release factor N(5)-glutamine methyltransferase [Anaerolineae bacterium]|nr:peptide chain release factor N(5)-glutamine methyltransferase [Anaerolineae bacterium]
MVTAVEQGRLRLESEGVESPRLDAELLLAHVLGGNRAAVLAHPERRLTPKELTRYRALVERRSEREPLAYVVGRREFYGLDFAVDRRVLIPRPETELLVERAVKRARQVAAPRIADVGAGSGAIAVTLAVQLPAAAVYALDASAGALEVTAENARRHGVAGRVTCLQGNLLEPLPERVHLIVANLPYVTTAEWQELMPEIRGYEPRQALDGGQDGLDLVRALLANAGPWLEPGGAVMLEIGAGQGEAAVGAAREYLPQANVSVEQDYAGLDRVVVLET